MAYTVDSEGTVTSPRVSDRMARAQAWINAMQSYKRFEAEPRDPVEDAKEAYVAGEITIEAFERRLNVAFHLS